MKCVSLLKEAVSFQKQCKVSDKTLREAEEHFQNQQEESHDNYEDNGDIDLQSINALRSKRKPIRKKKYKKKIATGWCAKSVFIYK